MKLLFKQRLFSWFDSYNIYDEMGNIVYEVNGQLAWGHCLRIYDAQGCEVGEVKQRILAFLPKFELYKKGNYIGCISKKFTLLFPAYDIDYNGWYVEGDFMEWAYQIYDSAGRCIAAINKEIFNLTDTYSIDVPNPQNALSALMVVLAIDAEKCSRN